MRHLVLGDGTAQHQRQRGDADAVDVGAMVEPGHAGRRRNRDPELLPQAFAGELQLLDARSEHVLHDHQPRVRRDHQALGRDQSVRGVARVLVQQRHRRYQLPNQAQRRVGVELQPALVRHPEQVRQPRALDVVRHDRQAAAARQAVDPPHPRVIGVPEVHQPRGAFAQRELERGDSGQLRTQPQHLQQFARRGISGQHPFAEAVGEERSVRAIERKGGRRHVW